MSPQDKPTRPGLQAAIDAIGDCPAAFLDAGTAFLKLASVLQRAQEGGSHE